MQGLAYLSLALNQVIGSVGFLLLAKEESDRELQKAATTDNLTGILNRRTFREPAKASVAHCARKGESIALAIMDLDYFKRINDEYGHLAGDESVGITVSAGILARTATESLNLDELFRLADEALYRAKAEGRNRVVAAE